MSTLSPLRSQLEELAQDWLASSSRRPATQRAYWVEVRRLQAWTGTCPETALSRLPADFLCRFLGSLSSQDPTHYLALGIRKPLQPSSVLQSKRILSALFLWGAEQGRAPLTTVLQARRWEPDETVRARRRPAKPAHSRKSRKVSAEGVAALRREFVQGLAFWMGARPMDICALRRASLHLRDEILEVELPDGVGRPMRSFGPPALARCWQQLKQATPHSAFAILHLEDDRPVTPSTVARVLMHAPDRPMSARDLRCAGIRHLRRAGWSEAEIRRQYRRRALPQDQRRTADTRLRERARALFADSAIPNGIMRR